MLPLLPNAPAPGVSKPHPRQLLSGKRYQPQR